MRRRNWSTSPIALERASADRGSRESRFDRRGKMLAEEIHPYCCC